MSSELGELRPIAFSATIIKFPLAKCLWQCAAHSGTFFLIDKMASSQQEAATNSWAAARTDSGPVGVPNGVPCIPDYALVRRIGGGAYGEVWLARSLATGIARAAKIVWRRNFLDDRPFLREFEGIQHFERISREHPSQLGLFHIGRNEAEGYFYYVMELADDAGTNRDGQAVAPTYLAEKGAAPAQDSTQYQSPRTLRSDLANGRLPAQQVLQLGLALAEALGHLHRNGLVHRDVKPSNVIFVRGRPKLADIGLVTDAGDECSIVGTEGYLPPEGPGTPQADLFALGKVLYEALTGQSRRDFPRLPETLRSWPDAQLVLELNEIVLKACAADYRERYESADSMLADLQLLQQGESVKRRRALLWLWNLAKRIGIGAVAFGLLAFVVISWIRPATQTDPYPDGPPSTNLDANAFCEKAVLILREENYAGVPQAYTNFHRAIELAPDYVRAYAGLFNLLLRQATPGLHEEPGELQKVEQKLIELAPQSSAAAVAQSSLSFGAWDFPAAKRYALQAIKANPKSELAHSWYGFLLTRWGWPHRALAELTISQGLEPSSSSVHGLIGHAYQAQRDFPNAVLWHRKAIALESHPFYGYTYMGRALLGMNDYSNAITAFETRDLLHPDDPIGVRQRYQKLRESFARAGAKGYWQQEWEFARNEPNLFNLMKPNQSFYWKAIVQIHLGNTNAALDYLERQTVRKEQSQPYLKDLLFDDCWDPLHEHPRFRALLEQLGFTKVMPSDVTGSN